jgi:SAM-dependent methyltransferase
MNTIHLAKRFLPPVVADYLKIALRKYNDPVRGYVAGGRIPWSQGYLTYKAKLLSEALEDKSLLELFRNDKALPPNYGIGIDERCIEYPWLFAHLNEKSERILDAGSILNRDYLLQKHTLANKVIHIMTLGPEKSCFWRRGISYFFSDLRDIPIRDGYYDEIISISTLEHVGFDNTGYTRNDLHREHHLDAFVDVAHEFRRVLKPGGTLLLTVPFGAYRCFRTCQIFDRALLSKFTEEFGRALHTVEKFFQYTAQGWRKATAEECADSEYVEWAARWNENRPNPLPVEPDLAAAARAVACMKIVRA